jgi:EAL domain-containing protein (putative c-di-GMP-specific phosphodiesterase class I)
VLDDEEVVLDLLTACLRAPGIRLTTCREIEAAETLLACFHYDAVVTDLSVSELGGLEGMRLVRFVVTHFPDTAVFVLSGFLDEPVRALCAAFGVTAALAKPEGLADLRSLLLARRRPQDAAEGEGEVESVVRLQEFLAANTLSAVLQPVVRLRAGGEPFEVFGVEGLARGPAESLLGRPAVLFGYAAHKELLFEVDLLCMRAALAETQLLGHPVTVFLNVQPRSLTHPQFTAELGAAVGAARLAARQVVLELTEQQTIVNPRALAATLEQLRGLGFRVALDDYGDGFSNLNLFLTLRPDFLKIAGTFSDNLAHDARKQVLVGSTAEMAARAGTATIMEAVETAADAEVLLALGVDYGQGRYFQPPLPGAELARAPRIALQSLHTNSR